MTRNHHRIFRLLAATVAAAALLAPVAGAADRGGSAGTGSPEPSGATLRNDIAHHGRQSVPAAAPSKTVLNDLVHSGNQGVLPAQVAPAPIVVRVDGGFDWISAGVGAAGGFGLLLVVGAATSTLRRRHRIDPAQA